MLALSLPVCATLTAGQRPVSAVKADDAPMKWLVQMSGRMTLNLDDPGIVCEIGRQLPLVQQNEKYFIAMVESAEGEKQLCAFPRYSGNESIAWVSAEKLMVFSRRTESTAGNFILDEDEMLPLLKETEKSYLVDVQRYRRHVALEVSKTAKGVILIPTQPARPVSSAGLVASSPKTAQAVKSATMPVDQAPAAPPAVVAVPDAEPASPELSVAKIKDEVLQELLLELDKAKQERAAEKGAEKKPSAEVTPAAQQQIPSPPLVQPVEKPQPVVVVLPPTPPVQPVVAPEVQEPKIRRHGPWPQEPADRGYVTDLVGMFMRENFQILALAAIMIPLIVFAMSRLRARGNNAFTVNPDAPSVPRRAGRVKPSTATPAAAPTASAPVATEVFTFSSVGQSVTPDTMKHQLADHGDLSGTLDGFILPQVIQFFCSAHESGQMTIRQSTGQTEELIFKEGQIIDARSGGARGKAAAHIILQQRSGTFHFRRGAAADRERTIMEDTMSLLLEVHTIMDEARHTSGGARR